MFITVKIIEPKTDEVIKETPIEEEEKEKYIVLSLSLWYVAINLRLDIYKKRRIDVRQVADRKTHSRGSVISRHVAPSSYDMN